MADAKFRVTADSRKAQAELQKVIKKQDELIRRFRSGERASRRAERESHRRMRKLKSIGSGLLGIFGIGGGLVGGMAAFKALIGDALQNMKELATETQRAGNEAVALAMMQKGGKARERVVAAQATGARYGVSIGEGALNIAQVMQAQTGDWQAGLDAARATFRLSGWAQVPAQAATTAVSTGIGQGLSPGLAARLPYAAGEMSSLSAAELAEVGVAMPVYRRTAGGPGRAYGVAAALSNVFKRPKMLRTATKNLAMALFETGGKWGEYMKGLPGYEEGDIATMLQAMAAQGVGGKAGFPEEFKDWAELGDVDSAELMQRGLGSKRARLALAAFLSDIEGNVGTMRAVEQMAARPGLITRKRAGAEEGFPELRFTRELDALEAQYAASRGISPTEAGQRTALKAMQLKKGRMAHGIALAEAGYGWALPSEGGARLRDRFKVGLYQEARTWASILGGDLFADMDVIRENRAIRGRVEELMGGGGDALAQELARIRQATERTADAVSTQAGGVAREDPR